MRGRLGFGSILVTDDPENGTVTLGDGTVTALQEVGRERIENGGFNITGESE
ncbi:MAG TPA: hypothetical protein VGG13_02470 [Candidatus Saccharimonadales bacterium]|jgi:hypothetical protein